MGPPAQAPPAQAQSQAEDGAINNQQLHHVAAVATINNPYKKKKKKDPPPPPPPQDALQAMMHQAQQKVKQTTAAKKAKQTSKNAAAKPAAKKKQKVAPLIGGNPANRQKKQKDAGVPEDSKTQGEGAPATKSTWSKASENYLKMVLLKVKEDVAFSERGKHELLGKWPCPGRKS
jgi:hypothetical protein